jgi:hypothetical protein
MPNPTCSHRAFAYISWRLIMLLVLGSFVSALGAGPQALDNCADAKAVPAPTYSSFFGRQVSIVTESETWRVELVGRAASPGCPSSYQFLFHANSKVNKTITKFTLCNETAQIDEVDLISPARVLVLGRLAANAPMANVLELPSGRVVDHFMCFMPAVSPSHHFLAFLKSFPGHPGPAMISAEYLVYDLTRSPDDNRPRLSSGISDAGWPVYPLGATNAPGSSVVPQGEPYHSWTSQGLFWIGSDKLTFADLFEGHNRLVLVDLSGGIRDLRVHSVDLEPSQFVDLSQCKQSFSQSDFEKLSQEEAGLIEIAAIESSKPGWVCLRFVPNRCLKYASRVIRLPGDD